MNLQAKRKNIIISHAVNIEHCPNTHTLYCPTNANKL